MEKQFRAVKFLTCKVEEEHEKLRKTRKAVVFMAESF